MWWCGVCVVGGACVCGVWGDKGRGVCGVVWVWLCVGGVEGRVGAQFFCA